MRLTPTHATESITAFNKAFAHPIGVDVAKPEYENLHVRRRAWLEEEIIELEQATETIDVVDALIDCIYYVAGDIVAFHNREIVLSLCDYILPRIDSDNFKMHEPTGELVPLDRYFNSYVNLSQHQSFMLFNILEQALYNIHPHTQALFDVVHDANMSKLHDGVPKYRVEDGKIIKPEGWEAPEPKLKMILDETRYTDVPEMFKSINKAKLEHLLNNPKMAITGYVVSNISTGNKTLIDFGKVLHMGTIEEIMEKLE